MTDDPTKDGNDPNEDPDNWCEECNQPPDFCRCDEEPEYETDWFERIE